MYLATFVTLLQPENLLVTSGAYATQLVLVDFGDARLLAFDSYVHALIGPAEFAAPELVRGLPIGFKTDIWLAPNSSSYSFDDNFRYSFL